MKRRDYRALLNSWTRTASLAALVGVNALPAPAQEMRALSKIVQPPTDRRPTVASPEWAVETLRAVDSTTSASRAQAVGVLGTTAWQTDTELENALVLALRRDPSEVVRIQAATALNKSRYLTAKAHAALKHSQSASKGDGHPSEVSAGVKWIAGQALQKHPAPAAANDTSRFQQETARAKLPRPTLGAPSEAVPAAKRDGAEESENIFSRLPRLGRPVPTDVPDVPCACKTENVSPVQSAVPVVNAPAYKAPVVNAPVASVPFANAPVPSVPVANLPAPYQPAPSNIRTVSTPTMLPPVTPIPTTDRQPEEKASTLPDVLPADPGTMTLKERRAELREMGLQDSTLKLFAEQVGAPPPSRTNDSPSFFRRMFGGGTRPATQALDQMPRSSQSLGVTPISSSAPLRTP